MLETILEELEHIRQEREGKEKNLICSIDKIRHVYVYTML